MASITFDFLSRGAAALSRDFRSIGDDSALSSRGVKVLQDIIEKLGDKEKRTSAESAILSRALRQTGDASAVAAAKMVTADAAVRRLGDAMQDSQKKSDGLGKALGNLKPNPGLAGPLLALVPALGTLTGVVAAAGAGLAGAFVAGGGALAAFGAVAKPVLSDALKAEQKVETAAGAHAAAVEKVTAKYQYAMSVAKTQAQRNAAYAAEQKGFSNAQIAQTTAQSKAYAGMSDAQIRLSQQLGAMSDAWNKVKTAQTPVIAGALQPWLKSVTDLTKNLAPIIAAVAPVIKALGVQFDNLVNSAAFKGFRGFIAGTGAAAVSAGGSTIIDLVKSFMILLPKFDPLIREAVGWISRLGPAVLAWSSSKKAADDIQSFIRFFSQNGAVVGGLLKNIGGALKALAPGLTAGGAVELKVISDFFGLVAKLPASFAKPLTEVAGALLIMSKLGVLKVGVQIIGAAAKWLTGGIITLGGDSAAAAMRAAFASGGAAAAAEIRAALAGGGAAAGAGGAAGKGAGAGAAGGAGAAASAALGVAVAGAFAGALIKAVGDTLSPKGTFAGRLNNMFQNLQGPVSTSVLHAFTFGGLEAWVTAKIGQPVGAALNTTGKFIQNTWATIWANTVGGASNDGKRLVTTITSTWSNVRAGAVQWWGNITRTITGFWGNLKAGAVLAFNTVKTDIANTWSAIWTNTRNVVGNGVTAVAGFWRTLQTGVVNAYNNVRTSIANTWSTIWSNTRTAVTTGISTVVTFFTGLPGKITSALGKAATVLSGWGTGVINGLLAGMTSVITSVWTFIKGIPGKILSFLGIKSPPQWAIDAGKHIMNGVGIGMAQAQGKLVKDTAQFSASALAGSVGGGVEQWRGLVVKALRMEGLSQQLTDAVLYQMQTESGGRVNAINLTDINAQRGDPSRGLMQVIGSTFRAYHWPGTSNNIYDPLANIAAALNYARHNYGPGLRNAYGGIGSGHGYAYGTSSAAAGWGWVGERGPELVRFRGGEQVIPAGQGTGGDIATELRALRAEVRQLTGVAAGIPAATGHHVGGAINSAAGAASFQRRYPRGGA